MDYGWDSSDDEGCMAIDLDAQQEEHDHHTRKPGIDGSRKQTSLVEDYDPSEPTDDYDPSEPTRGSDSESPSKNRYLNKNAIRSNQKYDPAEPTLSDEEEDTNTGLKEDRYCSPVSDENDGRWDSQLPMTQEDSAPSPGADSADDVEDKSNMNSSSQSKETYQNDHARNRDDDLSRAEKPSQTSRSKSETPLGPADTDDTSQNSILDDIDVPEVTFDDSDFVLEKEPLDNDSAQPTGAHSPVLEKENSQRHRKDSHKGVDNASQKGEDNAFQQGEDNASQQGEDNASQDAEGSESPNSEQRRLYSQEEEEEDRDRFRKQKEVDTRNEEALVDLFREESDADRIEQDVAQPVKKTKKKLNSKKVKKKGKKLKKDQSKKSQGKQLKDSTVEDQRFVEIRRDRQSTEIREEGELEGDGGNSHRKSYGEKMSLEMYEQVFEIGAGGNQDDDEQREPGEIVEEGKKRWKKRDKKEKKKKKNRREVATVEEANQGDEDSQKFPSFLAGFFVQDEGGEEELEENVENLSRSFETDNDRTFQKGGKIYRKRHSSEAEDSVKSFDQNVTESQEVRTQEVEHRKNRKHEERSHEARDRRQYEARDVREVRREREHHHTTPRERDRDRDHERERERERSRNERERERVRVREREREKERERERERDRAVVWDRDRDRSRRLEVEERRGHHEVEERRGHHEVEERRGHHEVEERRGHHEVEERRGHHEVEERRGHHIRSSSHEHRRRSNTADRARRSRSRDRSSRHRRHRTKSRERSAEREREREKERERSKRRHRERNHERETERRVRRASHSRSRSPRHRSERAGSDKENRDENHRRRRHVRAHGRSESEEREENHRRHRRERRELERGSSASSSSSASSDSGARHRSGHNYSFLSHYSSDEGESSDVILVEPERIVINLDEEEDPPSRVDITHANTEDDSTKLVDGESIPPPPELSRNSRSSALIQINPAEPETEEANDHSEEGDATPTRDERSDEAQSPWHNKVVQESDYDPAHPTEEAEEPENRSLSPDINSSPEHTPTELGPAPPDHSPLEERRPTPPPGPSVMEPSSKIPLSQEAFMPGVPRPPLSLMSPFQRQPLPQQQVPQQQPPLLPFPGGAVGGPVQGQRFPPWPHANGPNSHILPQGNGPMSGFRPAQQSFLPSPDPRPFFPVENSRLPLPMGAPLPRLSHPPPQREQLLPQQASTARPSMPLSALAPLAQLTSLLPALERAKMAIHRDDHSISQSAQILKHSLQAVVTQPAVVGKSPLVSSSATNISVSVRSSRGEQSESTEVVDMDMSPGEDDCELELPSPNSSDSERVGKRRKARKSDSRVTKATAASGTEKGLIQPAMYLKALSKAIEKLTPKTQVTSAGTAATAAAQEKTKSHSGKKKKLEVEDDVPASAVDLTNKEKYLKKLHLQERVIDEVKLAIKPFYSAKKITKEQYKLILRKAVPKVCHSKSGNINPQKIQQLVEAYVGKLKKGKTPGGGLKKKRAARDAQTSKDATTAPAKQNGEWAKKPTR
ncbi:unnamed protein product [Candidula unifasciata]|uniref:SFR19-like C-terminal domain-containing protein n=1 Tax=Candidula unifasciata TaxID=100452 RepID=A0A8S3YPI5_9EUPU|nr:unnamed protein product [Candidula unifasciata]